MSRVKVGIKYQIYYFKGNPNNRTLHIRAIVDDEHIVFKFWSRNKQRWIYDVRHESYFEMLFEGKRIRGTK